MFLCVGLLAQVPGNSQGLSRNAGYCDRTILLVPKTVQVTLSCSHSWRPSTGRLHSQPSPHLTVYMEPPPVQSYHLPTNCCLPSDHGWLVVSTATVQFTINKYQTQVFLPPCPPCSHRAWTSCLVFLPRTGFLPPQRITWCALHRPPPAAESWLPSCLWFHWKYDCPDQSLTLMGTAWTQSCHAVSARTGGCHSKLLTMEGCSEPTWTLNPSSDWFTSLPSGLKGPVFKCQNVPRV